MDSGCQWLSVLREKRCCALLQLCFSRVIWDLNIAAVITDLLVALLTVPLPLAAEWIIPLIDLCCLEI